ncbi:MAG: replicative DNA helicase [Clostridia bacterium]|jgi:replicative DNA helicase|nr:replicative DNA helicase [Clostridia bacterium]MDD4571215.1 replicative DNA helicase [Clostridia bacterium]
MGLERIPPQSITAEKAVLGACLLNENAVYSAMEQVQAADFYKKENQLIFQAILDLNAKNINCDLVTVMEELEKRGQLESIGGAAYLAELTGEVPSAAAAAHYGKIVADKALQRLLILAAQQVVDDGFEGHKDVVELLGNAESAIVHAGERKLKRNYRIAEEVMMAEFEKIDTLKSHDGITGIPTFRDLDRYLSGLQKGDLIILAARPGCGKTSMALNIAANAAVDHAKSVLVFSLEMPVEQLAQRVLCGKAKVDQGRWRSGRLSDEEIGRLSSGIAFFNEKKLFLDDSPGITIPEMRANCRRIQAEHGLDLVVVDYLQLMRSHVRSESRQLEIAEISRSLKAMAKELSVPVLALSQLSRLAEQSGEKGPQLSHLRESGSLEQDADVVLFINRRNNDMDDGGTGDNVVDVIVAKNRNGPTGEERLAFLREYTLFADLAEDWIGDE